ncbi:hypothetical protein GCM10010492_55050 [Saccharothrix mutabilis subsp. mutabilis]|uniref:Uncharacterized protein n=1 Tax=Saccharothrix mutabilis subsp. mutabilis TaxID=66855 RepID=A0ABN0UER4_9PSEU
MRKLLTACLAALLAVPTAATADAKPAPCSRAELLFCEDFERVATGGATSLKWGVDTKDGTLTVERHGRNKVLHAHTVGNGRAFLRVDHFSAPGNSFHGRARIRVAAFPTEPDWAHYTLVETTGDGPEIIRPLGGQYVPTVDKALWGVGADGGPTGDWTNWRESAPSRAGVWQCVEWHMDATDNRVTVSIDGRPKPDLTVSTKVHGGNPVDFLFPRFDAVKFGWQLYQPNPGAYDVWLDDLALSTRRIGC